MIAAGLDIGALYTKAVVLDQGEVVGAAAHATGENSRAAAFAALDEALAPASATRADVGAMVATGAGRSQLEAEATQATEIVCAVTGCNALHPGQAGVIDLGAESTRVVRLDGNGTVQEFALNDKCASGTGIFLDAIGDVMGLTLAELGPLSLESTADIQINTTCVVFAESEVVSLVHRQTPKRDILRGIHRAIAKRVVGQVNRVDLTGVPLAIGGLAQNVGLLACLRELLDRDVTVPEQPTFVSALGAAHLATKNGGASC